MNAPISQRRRVPVAVVAAIASASLAMAIPSLQHDAQGHEEGHASAGVNAKQLALHDGMRKLWEDHITWTRLFIVSAVDELPDAQATTDRLLKNQKHIGNAIKPFYGKAAGNQLTALLREHILVAADLLGAAKAGDQDEVDEQSALWYRNGREVAGFLHKANPDSWHRKEMRTMMRDHLDLTLDEAVAHLTRDHDADIAAYDKIHRQILHMADMLSDGIVAQFPDRF